MRMVLAALPGSRRKVPITGRRGGAGWWLLWLACGCASQGAPAARPVARAQPATIDAVSVKIFADLQNDDIDGATRNFGRALAWEVSPYVMRGLWRQIVDELGPLKSTRIVERGTEKSMDTRVLALEFERGQLRGYLAVNPEGSIVEQLVIQPVEPGDHPPPAPVPALNSEAPLVGGGRAIEVLVGSPPWTMRGTVTLPPGAGPFPGAILVHGSGPHDRDETIGPNKPFKDIAEGLAAHGVAVLRYDKRTKVHRLAHPEKVTVEEEVLTDAVAAFGLLRARQEVRKDRLFVIGHSLGAQLAPEIGQRSPGTAGLVLLAPPGQPMPTIITRQLRSLGRTPADELAALERQAAAIVAGQARPDDTFAGVPVHYLMDLGRRDAFRVARALGKPILLLRGERDYQVTADDLRIWQERLAGAPEVSASTLPALNHLFIAGSGPPGPAEYGVAGHVHPSVILRLADFINRTSAASSNQGRRVLRQVLTVRHRPHHAGQLRRLTTGRPSRGL
jgi:dienelactone hydrolase